MIIYISKSILFTVDPDKRFSREYSLPLGTWTELWKRYKLLGYDIPELCEYHLIKTGKATTPKSMRRWIWRTEVYSIAGPALKKGAQTIVSSMFGEHEWEVVKELTKNLRSSVHKDSKSLV